MRVCSYGCFVPVLSVIFLVIASYSLVGIVINSMFLDKSNFHGVWPLNEKCAIVVLMVAQSLLLLFVSGLGFGGVLLKSILIWYIPGFVLMGIGVTLASFAGVTLKESSKDFSHDIINAGRKVNGTQAEDFFDWLSDIQWEYDCCGILSYKDYLQFKFPNLSPHSLPQSCCLRNKTIPTTQCGTGLLRPENSIQKIQEVVMLNGCGTIMSELHGAVLFRLGMEMLIVGILCLSVAALIYCGVFQIVIAELTNFDENEEEDPPQVETGGSLIEAVSSTTAANTYSNANGISRNAPNRRRIFRTRRHGGGESIVSFAVDSANNNLSPCSTPTYRGGPGANRPRIGQIGGGKRKQMAYASQTSKKHQVRQDQDRARPTAIRMLPLEDKGFPNTSTMEMLLKPRHNNSSILSTTSNQSFISYFNQNQKKRTSDTSDEVCIGQQPVIPATHITPLAHYSSLPHVNKHIQSPILLKLPGDPKTRALAELKHRFPPGIPLIGPRPKSPTHQLEEANLPPVNSQTQHIHYCKVLPNNTPTALVKDQQLPIQQVPGQPPVFIEPFIDGKFPSVALESELDTIQEESEGSRSTVPPPEQVNRVSIFEIFGQLERNSDTLNPVNTTSAPSVVEPSTELYENEHELSAESLPEAGEIIMQIQPNFLNSGNDTDNHEAGARWSENTEGMEVNTTDNKDKEKVDPEIEGLIYA